MRVLRTVDRILLFAGLAMLSVCAVAYLDGTIHARLAVREYKRELAQTEEIRASSNIPPPRQGDVTLSTKKERQHHVPALGIRSGELIALLRIPRLGVEVPVFDGTDSRTLNRGVGRIPGTALPGENGNLGIAGHRDRFFRPLQKIEPTDTIQLITNSGTYTYAVDSLQIVDGDDVSVLKGESTPALTLVTCYPFFFVGSAPRRFIAHAVIQPTKESTKNRATVVRSINATFQENAQ